MATRMLTTFLVILVFLIDAVYGYTCTYYNRYGSLIYLYCPYSECCGSYRHRYCCRTYSVGGLVGGVIGFLIFVGLIAACVSCFCCACCPVYQRRSRQGYIVTQTAPNYSSTANVQPSQPYQSTVGPTQAGPYSSPPPQYKP